ncbi:FtsX-like permease family protein [Streptomyces solicathayae]|uniref:FtsX-like permease family protein n=1 Tax=Streptomyces solicathayae TaxID=3081768 RepID=A0ABZ0LTY1_9ACTN|nr:FtsX-like permease family protein [Streptomyces sp. HUAS YS2]WOX22960.1 FtsX-like permease family protein [Streptomyces sp. HUAS YS2]
MLTVALTGLRTRWAGFVGSFVALALGVGLLTTMGLGLASTLHAPERQPERFAAAPVVVMGQDTVEVDVQRGPDTVRAAQKLDRPHPVDAALLNELRTRWRVTVAGGPDAVGVHGPADRVRALVGDRAQVLTGADRRLADPDPERDEQALVALNALLGTSGGVTSFVSVFVVASTFAFAVALRRREFGLLRTAGATPGQVRRLLLAEAAGVGVLASAAGCALGAWAAPRLARLLVDEGVAPEWFAIGDARWPFHAAFWTGVTVAVAGAVAASRRAGRIGPTAALREADVDTGVLPLGRRLLGAGLLLTGVVLLVWTCVDDPYTLLKRKTYTTQPMIMITGVALLAPLLVRPVARLLPLPGVTGMLVRANTAAALRRTSAVAAPVLVTVALAGSLFGSAVTVTTAKGAESREQTAAGYVITGGEGGAGGAGAGASGAGARGVGLGAGRGLSADGLRAVAGATVSATGATSVFVRDGDAALVKYGARAVADPAAFADLARLPVLAGDVRDLDDRSIVVNQEWERRRIGDRVQVWLADGRTTTLRVVAVLAPGTGDNGPYVTTANAPGTTVDRIDVGGDVSGGPALERAMAATGGTVRTADAWAAETHPPVNRNTRLGLMLVLGIAVVYTVIALANTLVMATSVRGGELGALRMTGATRAQILRVVAGEALFSVAIGSVLGVAVTAVGLAGLGAALASLSAPVAVAVPWAAVGAAAGTCAVVATVAAVLPAWRLTR